MKPLKIGVIKQPSNNRRTFPSLGLGYITAFLKKEGFDVEFVDATLIDFPFHLLSGIPRFYWKEARIIDWEKLRSFFLTRERDMDIAFIGGSFTADIYNTARIADIIKERNKSCITVVGGTHVSALPEETLHDFPNIDIVVLGEGEYIARDIARAFQEERPIDGLKGIAYRDKAGMVVIEQRVTPIPDISTLPFPARDLMPIDKYRMIWRKVQTGPVPGFISDPAALMITSRGCIRQCLFCAIKEISGGRMRLRSAENVIEEIDSLVMNYQVKIIGFLDDFFTIDSERTLKICKVLKKYKLKWYCYGLVSTVSESLLKEMKASGCRLINFGLESGDQEILDRIGKGTTLKQVNHALGMARKAGINYVASFTVGMPGETEATIKKTVRMIKTFGGLDASLSRITPYPGSPLYRMAIDNKWLISKKWDMYDASIGPEVVYVPPGWSKEEFQKQFLWARSQVLRHFMLRHLLRGSIFRRIPGLLRSLFARGK